jgi:hypothetical protein
MSTENKLGLRRLCDTKQFPPFLEEAEFVPEKLHPKTPWSACPRYSGYYIREQRSTSVSHQDPNYFSINRTWIGPYRGWTAEFKWHHGRVKSTSVLITTPKQHTIQVNFHRGLSIWTMSDTRYSIRMERKPGASKLFAFGITKLSENEENPEYSVIASMDNSISRPFSHVLSPVGHNERVRTGKITEVPEKKTIAFVIDTWRHYAKKKLKERMEEID